MAIRMAEGSYQDIALENIAAVSRVVKGQVNECAPMLASLAFSVDPGEGEPAVQSLRGFIVEEDVDPEVFTREASTPGQVLQAAAEQFEIEPFEIIADARGRQETDARHTSLVLMRDVLGMTDSDIVEALYRHPVTVKRGLAAARKRAREDEKFVAAVQAAAFGLNTADRIPEDKRDPRLDVVMTTAGLLVARSVQLHPQEEQRVSGEIFEVVAPATGAQFTRDKTLWQLFGRQTHARLQAIIVAKPKPPVPTLTTRAAAFYPAEKPQR